VGPSFLGIFVARAFLFQKPLIMGPFVMGPQ
jgi:hypothetical protein